MMCKDKSNIPCYLKYPLLATLTIYLKQICRYLNIGSVLIQINLVNKSYAKSILWELKLGMGKHWLSETNQDISDLSDFFFFSIPT